MVVVLGFFEYECLMVCFVVFVFKISNSSFLIVNGIL